MIRLKTGEVYMAERARSGSSANGPWELLVIKEGRDEMTLWVTNVGTGIMDGGQFRVTSIDLVTRKNAPYKDGKLCRDRRERDVQWRTEVDCNVTVEPISLGYSGLDITAAEFDDGSDLPFNMNDSPFDIDPLPL